MSSGDEASVASDCGDRDGVATGRQIQRPGNGFRLEVVQGQCAVDVDVDGQAGDAVYDVDLGGVRGRSRERTEQGSGDGE